MLTKNHFDIADPASYGREKSYRYLIHFGFADTRRPQGRGRRLNAGTVTIVRFDKIRSADDQRALETDITVHFKKQYTQWNGAKLVVLGFSRYED